MGRGGFFLFIRVRVYEGEGRSFFFEIYFFGGIIIDSFGG